MAQSEHYPAEPAAWGFWATLGWAVLAFVVSQIVAIVVLLIWRHGDVAYLLANPYDGAVVTISVLVINPAIIAIVAFAARLAGGSPLVYLGLVPARPHWFAIGLIGIAVIIAATDALLFVTGRDIVSPFQVDSYTSAVTEGWIVGLLLAIIIVGPAGEEIMFRGFLFRGWVRSPRSVWIAIAAISFLWMLLHVQYDWTGMLQIFVTGLFLGWLRWRSGSTLLTFVLHALFNLEGTIETVIRIKYFS